MARVTAAEAARTRDALLDAALEVFYEQGVARPSLTTVARRAGRTRGAIYGHFANKEDLFAALCDRYLSPAEVLAEAREQAAGDPLGALVAWLERVLSQARENREYRMLFAIVFLGCEAVEGDALHERLRDDDARVLHHECALLHAAVARGQLPADLDVRTAALAVHGLLSGLLRLLALDPSLEIGALTARLDTIVRELLQGDALRHPSNEE